MSLANVFARHPRHRRVGGARAQASAPTIRGIAHGVGLAALMIASPALLTGTVKFGKVARLMGGW